LLGSLSQRHPGAKLRRARSAGSLGSRPLRVLFVLDHLGQTPGLVHGVTSYLLSTLPAFDPAAVTPSVCVLTPRHPLGAPMLETAGFEPVFLGRAKWDPRVVRDLIRLVGARDIDLLHVTCFKATMLGRLAAQLTGRAVVAHIHDAKPMPPWMRLIQRRLGPRTDAAVAVSKAVREVAVEDYGVPAERIRVLYNGVLADRFALVAPDARRRIRQQQGIAADAPVIGIVGRIEPGKGVKQLVSALPAVLERCPGAVLLVVGDGSIRRECQRLVEKVGVGAAVRFTGHRDDVPALLAAMDVMAAPAIAKEGLPYAVLEAMCAGVPVVATSLGGLGECVVHGETGLIVPMRDGPALAESLVTLLTDPALRRALGQAARRRGATFSVARHVDELQTIYRSIIAARTRQGQTPACAAELPVLAGHDSDHRPLA
jgi:glycosyltransferase involved in cell wall biosynthesis